MGFVSHFLSMASPGRHDFRFVDSLLFAKESKATGKLRKTITHIRLPTLPSTCSLPSLSADSFSLCSERTALLQHSTSFVSLNLMAVSQLIHLNPFSLKPSLHLTYLVTDLKRNTFGSSPLSMVLAVGLSCVRGKSPQSCLTLRFYGLSIITASCSFCVEGLLPHPVVGGSLKVNETHLEQFGFSSHIS